MARRRLPDDDPPDEWDDDPDDLPDGVYHDEGEDDDQTVPCPYCREPVYENAQFCGRCENYISKEDSPPSQKPRWVWVCLIVALAVTVMTLF